MLAKYTCFTVQGSDNVSFLVLFGKTQCVLLDHAPVYVAAVTNTHL